MCALCDFKVQVLIAEIEKMVHKNYIEKIRKKRAGRSLVPQRGRGRIHVGPTLPRGGVEDIVSNRIVRYAQSKRGVIYTASARQAIARK